MALRQFQLQPDAGHDNAIHYIYDNIVQVAANIQSANCIYTEEPKPADPLPRSRNIPDDSGQASGDERSLEPQAEGDFLLNRASWLDLRKEHHAYFICDGLCMLMKYSLGTTDDVMVEKPRLLTDKWSCLAQAGFFTADAVLPVPGKSKEAYFFYKTQYVLINLAENRIVNGPKVIVNEWPSLKASNFTSVDAALPFIQRYSTDTGYELTAENEAYFFRDKYYSLIKIKPGTTNDVIVNGPKLITTEWTSLRNENFATVDSTVAIPKSTPETFFFNGADYCRVKVARGTTNDSIVVGRRPVWRNWPPLADAFFY